ncbi:FAD-dependent oxidoreductase domain-containing protein 1-like [Oratosquilla oratoria]|uniref:FAD-dependent oxidoreductase domain-containing protein 1-like n=1 Tax=Oratosquilla oratoria TaxID=337810 RepID=UPI003F767F8A
MIGRTSVRILSRCVKLLTTGKQHVISQKVRSFSCTPSVWDDERNKQTGKDASEYREHYENPFLKTLGVMKDDVKGFLKNIKNMGQEEEDATPAKIFSEHCDVLIIGGGAIGSSIAYHLKERALGGLHIVVIEKDPTYSKCSTTLSVGGVRQQFSIGENVQLSLFGAEFLRNVPKLLAVEGADPPNIDFNPNGYLTLATEAGMDQLYENHYLQKELGAKVDLLSRRQLEERFPWMQFEDIAGGVIGRENEGWFDPWSFLHCLKRKAVDLGVEYITGKVVGFNTRKMDDLVIEDHESTIVKNVDTAKVRLENGDEREIKCSIAILASGAWSGEIGKLIGIGIGPGLLSTPIPVEHRKRYVYCFRTEQGPQLDCPLVINPNGTYFRREGVGGLYFCGRSPTEEQEPKVGDMEVDHDFFMEHVWPILAERTPSFEALKVQSAWAGHYDYNTFDQNGIIGIHPAISNLFIATGFSGHGIQQAAGVGRAVMERILHSEYMTVDLSRFGFERIIMNQPLFEKNIV